MNAATAAPLSAMGVSDKGQAYEEALDYQRARDRVFDRLHPKESTALQVAGGVASGLAAAPAALSTVGNMSRGGAVLTGGAAGAGVGGVEGYLGGEGGVDERLKSAGTGALVGGAVGAAAPLAIEGVQKGTRAVVDRLVQNDTLKRRGVSRPAADVVTRALDQDGALSGQGAANIRAGGPGAMIADAGPAAQGLLDTTIQRGGAGANAAREAIDARARDAARGVSGALDNALGRPVGTETAERAIRRGSAPARAAAYNAAYSKPVDYAHPLGMEIEELLQRVPKSAFDEANRLMKVRGEKSAQILASVADDGGISFKSLPDVRQLDYITRALREVADQADGQGKLGGQTAYGNAVRELADELRDRVKTLVPEYGRALETAAEPIAARNALRFGEDILSKAVPRDEAARTIARMSGPEREALKQGIRSHIDEALANVRRTITDPNVDIRQGMQAIKDLSSDAARTKIRLALGSKEADRLFGQIDEFTKAYELKGSVAQNSKTFARTALNDTVGRVTEPGPIGTAMEGRPVEASRKLVQAVLGTGEAGRTARQDEIFDQIATILTKPRGPQAVQFIYDLRDALRRRNQGHLLGDVLAKLTAGGAGGAYRAIEQSLGSSETPPTQPPARP